MQLSLFNFDLPPELIAKYPLAHRNASRLMHLEGNTGTTHDLKFEDLLSLLKKNDLIVFNNTRVVPARLFGKKATGGNVEILIDRFIGTYDCLAHIRASKAPKADSILNVKGIAFKVLGRVKDLYHLKCLSNETLITLLESIGHIPIPNYFERDAEESDHERYQTVYAQNKGSVAAPTAGLHFDEETLNQLTAQGVETAFLTLHVGAGTFQPVRVEDITQHHMHEEDIDVPAEVCEKIKIAKANNGRIIAVGTTTLRSLETAALEGEIRPYQGTTNLFIYPGFKFHCVDVLITNFHWPKSSLLMLVSAFAGHDHIMQAYQAAIQKKYRFYSYGDAMFIERQTGKVCLHEGKKVN